MRNRLFSQYHVSVMFPFNDPQLYYTCPQRNTPVKWLYRKMSEKVPPLCPCTNPTTIDTTD